MADDKQLRLTFTLPQQDALQLIQLAQSQFDIALGQDIQIEVVEPDSNLVNRLLFMSYRRTDSRDICGRIYDYLVQDFDRSTIFRDIESIPLGVDFSDEIVSNAESCDVMLAVVGPNWLKILNERLAKADEVDYVRLEIETALKRQIPVIPIYVNNASYLTSEQLPETLQAMEMRNAVVIRPDAHFRPDVRDLIRRIKTLFTMLDDPPE